MLSFLVSLGIYESSFNFENIGCRPTNLTGNSIISYSYIHASSFIFRRIKKKNMLQLYMLNTSFTHPHKLNLIAEHILVTNWDLSQINLLRYKMITIIWIFFNLIRFKLKILLKNIELFQIIYIILIIFLLDIILPTIHLPEKKKRTKDITRNPEPEDKRDICVGTTFCALERQLLVEHPCNNWCLHIAKSKLIIAPRLVVDD